MLTLILTAALGVMMLNQFVVVYPYNNLIEPFTDTHEVLRYNTTCGRCFHHCRYRSHRDRLRRKSLQCRPSECRKPSERSIRDLGCRIHIRRLEAIQNALQIRAMWRDRRFALDGGRHRGLRRQKFKEQQQVHGEF